MNTPKLVELDIMYLENYLLVYPEKIKTLKYLPARIDALDKKDKNFLKKLVNLKYVVIYTFGNLQNIFTIKKKFPNIKLYLRDIEINSNKSFDQCMTENTYLIHMIKNYNKFKKPNYRLNGHLNTIVSLYEANAKKNARKKFLEKFKIHKLEVMQLGALKLPYDKHQMNEEKLLMVSLEFIKESKLHSLKISSLFIDLFSCFDSFLKGLMDSSIKKLWMKSIRVTKKSKKNIEAILKIKSLEYLNIPVIHSPEYFCPIDFIINCLNNFLNKESNLKFIELSENGDYSTMIAAPFASEYLLVGVEGKGIRTGSKIDGSSADILEYLKEAKKRKRKDSITYFNLDVTMKIYKLYINYLHAMALKIVRGEIIFISKDILSSIYGS